LLRLSVNKFVTIQYDVIEYPKGFRYIHTRKQMWFVLELIL